MDLVVGARYQMQTTNGLITGDFVSSDGINSTFNHWFSDSESATTNLDITDTNVTSLNRIS